MSCEALTPKVFKQQAGQVVSDTVRQVWIWLRISCVILSSLVISLGGWLTDVLDYVAICSLDKCVVGLEMPSDYGTSEREPCRRVPLKGIPKAWPFSFRLYLGLGVLTMVLPKDSVLRMIQGMKGTMRFNNVKLQRTSTSGAVFRMNKIFIRLSWTS